MNNREGVYFKRNIVTSKLSHPLVIGFAILFAILSSVSIVFLGVKVALLLIAVLIGLPLIYAVIAYPKVGIITILFSSYLLLWFLKMGITFPLGTLMDGLIGLMLFGFLLKQKYNSNWTLFNNPLSKVILVWIGYNLLEVINPVAESRMAWVYTVRTVALVLIMYFIFLYNITSVNFIRIIFKIWIGLSFFAAIYGFKQEHFGFFEFEKNWLGADPVITSLYLVSGVWRKFSIFSDPVTFAYNMVISSILCFALITGPIRQWKKIALAALGIFFLITMVYSGTRGAFVLAPVALLMFCVLKFNRAVLFAGLIFGVVLVAMIKVPTSNPSLKRFQSAFYPSYDASYNVRKNNQKKIQPYILEHPMGGGLGATGTWGQRFSPDSYLANFPPDSGYVRVAAELGWIGLLVFCSMIFIALKTGINNYFEIKDSELKSYCLATILIVFTLNIGNYPQEALVQYPTNIYFSLVLALMNVTLTLDRKKLNNERV